jgi:CheY-like chemotaxis protein
MTQLLFVGIDRIEVAGRLLRRRDVSIEVAATRSDVAGRARLRPPDVVVGDLDALGEDGERLAADTLSGPEETRPKLILIAGGSPESLDRAARCRADAILLRPLRAEELADAVRRLEEVAERHGGRLALRLPVELTIGLERLACTSVDLGPSGLLLESDTRPLRVGESVLCVLELPAGDRLELAGSVTRVVGSGAGERYGIHISGGSARGRMALAAFVTSRLTDRVAARGGA